MSFDEQIGIIPNLNNLNLKRGKGGKKKKKKKALPERSTKSLL
jgi:hypothetical protein